MVAFDIVYHLAKVHLGSHYGSKDIVILVKYGPVCKIHASHVTGTGQVATYFYCYPKLTKFQVNTYNRTGDIDILNFHC